MPQPIRNQVESGIYRYLGFWLAISVITSIYLGWAAIFAWLLSAVALMALFSAFASGAE